MNTVIFVSGLLISLASNRYWRGRGFVEWTSQPDVGEHEPWLIDNVVKSLKAQVLAWVI